MDTAIIVSVIIRSVVATVLVFVRTVLNVAWTGKSVRTIGISEVMYKYGINFENRCHVFVDGANPEFIRALKDRLGEEIDYDRLITHLKSSYGSKNFGLTSLIENMCVIPINFRNEHRQMLAHAKRILEIGNDGGLILHPSFNKLIVALRTAVEKGDGSLDKEATSHNDVFDAFRLSLMRYR